MVRSYRRRAHGASMATHGKTWKAHRVGSLRSAEKNGEWLTMRDAAAKLGSLVLRLFYWPGPANSVTACAS
jgi:hypothetical protein